MVHVRRAKSAPAPGGHFPPLLAVDCAGRPIHWVGWQAAVRHYVLEQVAWTVGDPAAVVRGGISVSGVRSRVSLHPVIALHGADGGLFEGYTPPLSNPALFAQDKYRCLYCGEDLAQRKSLATRDHVHPRSRDGANTWENVVTTCHEGQRSHQCTSPMRSSAPGQDDVRVEKESAAAHPMVWSASRSSSSRSSPGQVPKNVETPEESSWATGVTTGRRFRATGAASKR